MSVQRPALRRDAARRSDLGSPVGWLLLGVALSAVAALLVAADVRRGWLALVALSAAYVLSCLSARLRLWGLFAAVLASALLTSSGGPIPFQLTLSQVLLLFVLGAEVLAAVDTRRGLLADTRVGTRLYVAFVAFAGLGLVSTYLNGEIFDYWPTVCLAPLALLYAVDRLVHDPETAFSLVRAAVVAALAFVAIIWIAQVTGHSHAISEYGSGFAGRFADAVQVDIGLLSFRVWSIRVGSLAALGMPAVLVLALGSGRRTDRWAGLAAVVVFVLVLGFTAARGAIIGAIVGGVVAIVVSRRLTVTRAFVFVMVAAVALAVAGPTLLDLFPEGGIRRILALGGGLGSIRNFVYRVNVWDVTLRGLLDRPLGPGFDYLWLRYRLDEAVAYTMILNGTGVLGFVAFVAMLAQLVRRYVRGLSARAADESRDLAAIGLGTLAAALLAAVSSQSVFIEPVQSTVFWSIEIAAVVGISLSASRATSAWGAADEDARTAVAKNGPIHGGEFERKGRGSE